jgi:hypothetical protein
MFNFPYPGLRGEGASIHIAGARPEPSVIYSPEGEISQKKIENPAGFWNNVGRNRSSPCQNKGSFE